MVERRQQEAEERDRSGRDGREPEPGRKSADFSAPLGSATEGRLVLAGGVAGLKLRSDATIPELVRAHFERQVPKFSVEGGTVTIDYRRLPVVDWLRNWSEPLARVTLNGSIPWRVDVQGGASNVEVDLQWARLLGLEIGGGASQVTLNLPQPTGTVAVRILGGVSNLTVYRPIGVSAQVQLEGGASNLTLDDQYFGSVGGPVRWQSPDYGRASDRYSVHLAGGASHLAVDSR